MPFATREAQKGQSAFRSQQQKTSNKFGRGLGFDVSSLANLFDAAHRHNNDDMI
jgi:hypothetical protein